VYEVSHFTYNILKKVTKSVRN